MIDITDIRDAEIRTPMNGVLGLVEVFENTPTNPDQSQMLGMIRDSASALLQILTFRRDLLDKTDARRRDDAAVLIAALQGPAGAY